MEARCVIIGAGFAGAATAFHLARRGVGPVVIVDREKAPGAHSSGRNASMVRQIVSDPHMAVLARAGARAIDEFARAGQVSFARNGSLLYAAGTRVESLRREAAAGRADGLDVRPWTAGEAAGRIPLLEDAPFDEGWFCPTDGVVDIAGLVARYIAGVREAGGTFIPEAEATDVVVEGGKVAAVRAGGRTIRTPAVVDAAGAWAGEIARAAGAAPIPIQILRRHLMFTGTFHRASADWPFVWDVAHELYFRPEADGLLFSPCDESEVPPGLPDEDPAAMDLLHEKVTAHLPGVGDFPVARWWAGVRMFSPDRRFVIGPDPVLPGFFWAAAMGGHGVTASAAVGALGADLVVRPELDEKNVFSPGRFARGQAAGTAMAGFF
jgi:D-arginine dehydrogenase